MYHFSYLKMYTMFLSCTFPIIHCQYPGVCAWLCYLTCFLWVLVNPTVLDASYYITCTWLYSRFVQLHTCYLFCHLIRIFVLFLNVAILILPMVYYCHCTFLTTVIVEINELLEMWLPSLFIKLQHVRKYW